MLKWICNWLRSVDWLPLISAALFYVLAVELLSSFGFPQHNQQADYATYNNPIEHILSALLSLHAEGWTALFTFTLTVSTIGLWIATYRIARDARDSARTLISMERPYVASGGDFEDATGKELYRLDVENHGKTAAFMVAYDLQFARLEELKKEFPRARCVRFKHHNHIDSLSPQGARKIVRTQIEKPNDVDIVFGCVWYEDIWEEKYSSRFILRIAPMRDIPKEGLTRLSGIEGVSSDYWKWEYPKKERA
jgi:hypothetical protein